jgi:cell fate (sporulation/competence/biofilm development) regulator YlbF (YheA/YmcA/DUF963 family)
MKRNSKRITINESTLNQIIKKCLKESIYEESDFLKRHGVDENNINIEQLANDLNTFMVMLDTLYPLLNRESCGDIFRDYQRFKQTIQETPDDVEELVDCLLCIADDYRKRLAQNLNIKAIRNGKTAIGNIMASLNQQA